ncbi:hypothetical protein FOA43_001760 [Brettanomyces nanus]|uniref:Dihydroxyacetone kinase n=1 Tax=Eeniella nana TaxID=13502 RepID=A0A875RY63_EENNA|nr:uncharacterized protein FOA43_001760 [Brettanomyces nanus]QPG74431.1 hypothetical protein FOA43_001760 [Brettanomyces nanus]
MVTTKQWIYEDELVLNSLRGLARSNPDLKYLQAERLVYCASSSDDKVTVLTGGGAGHEPMHAGFVGKGCLDVAVSGQVFASPSVKQIYAGLKASESKKGTLIVVKNYTGDIIHFGMAAERLSAEGYHNKILVVQDDVSVGKTKNGMVGRRALAGTCLLHKIVGAKAAKDSYKATLDDVYDIGQKVNENLVTIGASLGHVIIPHVGERVASDDSDKDDDTNIDLKDDEAEVGMGIHNEPGVSRVSPLPKIKDLVSNLLKYTLSNEDKDRHYVDFASGDEVALLVNNLGATSNLELYAIQNFVVEALEKEYGINPVRVYTGSLCTSLDGPGFSITLLNITKAGSEEIKQCLDYPTEAPGWACHVTGGTWDRANQNDSVVEEPDEIANPPLPSSHVTFDANIAKIGLVQGCHDLIKLEPKLTLYDSAAGDGDCGETLSGGAQSVLRALNSGKLAVGDAVKYLAQMTDLIETDMGGTSGGLYAIFISGMAKSLKQQELRLGKGFKIDLNTMATTLNDSLITLEQYTRARVGDRTLMDALIPFVEEFASSKDLKSAAEAADSGANATRRMAAKFGRATYVSEDEFKQFDAEGGLPDPGAIGLAALLKGFSKAVSK